MHKIVKMGLCVVVAFVMNISLALGMMEDEEKQNGYFYCFPIKRKVMRDSIEAVDGHSYENARTESLITGRPVKDLVIPAVAYGHEDVYRRFYCGKLIYRPTEGSDEGKIELPIAALANPLEGEFDLSKCGDAGQYLSIFIGYRKGRKEENENKAEIWIVPQFLVEKEVNTLASNHHMRAILPNWNQEQAPVGIFFTWGSWNSAGQMAYCDYLTSQSLDQLSSEDLYKKWCSGHILGLRDVSFMERCGFRAGMMFSRFVFELK